MDYTYRKFEDFGRVYFRILERNHDDVWRVAIGTFDWSDEADAKRTVEYLAATRKGRVVEGVQS